MKAKIELPDLAALSDAQKDALIRGLWDIIAKERDGFEGVDARLAAFEANDSGSDQRPRQLAAELREASRRPRPPAPSRAKARLGRQLGFWRSKIVAAVIASVGLAFAADYGIGWYQKRVIEHRRMTELRLRNAAFAGLYVELLRITYEPDGKSYRLVMSMKNVNPDAPLYVMLNPVRVFEQSGLLWKEVPSRPADGESWGVVKLTDRYVYQAIFEPNIADWAELIPGYMHIRIENDMLISQRSEPDEDVVDRKNPYYVYLKPHGADDEAIRRRSKYSGQPPVYIPMPPH